jgi:hypothetical protein
MDSEANTAVEMLQVNKRKKLDHERAWTNLKKIMPSKR